MTRPYYRARRVVKEKQGTLPYEVFATGSTSKEAVRNLNRKCKGFYYVPDEHVVHKCG